MVQSFLFLSTLLTCIAHRVSFPKAMLLVSKSIDIGS